MENKKKTNLVREIELEKGITASLENSFLVIKGPKGEVKRELKSKNVTLKVDSNKLILQSGRATKKSKKNVGTLVAHIKNMMKGTTQNHSYTLKICSGHFPMNVSVAGSKLVIKNFLGEKVPRSLRLKEGADVKVEGDHIYVTSPSKELAGQLSADIEQLTRRPGFDTRIFQDGIYITHKDGKELK